MKKKIIALILVVMSIFCFSGCSLVNQNATRYADEVLARVGDETITRTEVSSLFNTYYSYYGSQTDSETIFKTVWNQLISQKILLNEAKKVVLLSNEDINKIWQDVFDYIDEQVESLMVSEGYKDKATEKEEETKTNGFAYNPTKYETVNYNPETFDYKKDVAIINVYTKPTDEKELICYNKFVSSVVENAKTNGQNTNPEIALNKFISKIYKSFEDSLYTEKFEEYLKSKVQISDEEVLEEYNNQLNVLLQSYADEDYYNADMKNTGLEKLMLYVKNSSYFNVKHILISFSDEQSKELKGMTGADSSLDYVYREPYVTKRNGFATNLLVTQYKDPTDGKVYENEEGFDKYYDVVNKKFVSGVEAVYLTTIGTAKKVTVETIKSLVTDVMTSNELTVAQKLTYFDELMFIYGEDPGMQTTTTVAGVAGYTLPSIDSDDFEEFDFQVEFKDAVKEVYNAFDGTQPANGEYTSDGYSVAVSDNGVHIVVFAGVVGKNEDKNGVYFTPTEDSKDSYLVEQSAKGQAVTIQNLKDTKIGGFSQYSVYNYIYESLLASKVESASSEFIATTKAQYLNNKGTLVEIKDTYEKVFSK